VAPIFHLSASRMTISLLHLEEVLSSFLHTVLCIAFVSVSEMTGGRVNYALNILLDANSVSLGRLHSYQNCVELLLQL